MNSFNRHTSNNIKLKLAEKITKNADSSKKERPFQGKIGAVLRAFEERPKSRLMVSIETGINTGAVCYHVDKLKKVGLLFFVKLDKCEVSGYEDVQFFTSDKSLVPTLNTQSHE